jgi:hypothetical protein
MMGEGSEREAMMKKLVAEDNKNKLNKKKRFENAFA